MESFEYGLARWVRDADPGKQERQAANNTKQSKNIQKTKKKRKGSKGQKQKRNNRENGVKNRKGKRKIEKKKVKRKQKKRGKNGELEKRRKNQEKRMKKAQVRDSTCISTTCVNNAVIALKLLKDKVVNFEKQEKRISKKSGIGGRKSEKRDAFKPTLQRLSDAAGGNISAPVCSGSSDSAGAAQMLNLSMTLKTCATDIHTACDTSNLPTPNATKMTECSTSISTFKTWTDTCQKLTGSDACPCWSPTADVTAAMENLKTCDLSKINTAMVLAMKGCKSAFGKCRKYEDDVGDIIFACEQSPDTLKRKLKALSENSDKVKQVASKISEIVSGNRKGFGKFERADDATTEAGYINICTQINSLVAQNPHHYQIATLSTSIISVTAPTFAAANLASLSDVNTALQVSVTILVTAVATMQTTFLGKGTSVSTKWDEN